MLTAVLVIVAILCVAASTSWIRSAYYSYRHWRQTLTAIRKSSEVDVVLSESENSDLAEGSSARVNSLSEEESESASLALAKIAFQKSLHAAFLYASLALTSLLAAFSDSSVWQAFFVIVLLPALISIYWATQTKKELYLSEKRLEIERRAEATLTQDRLAPRAWADRLAPEELPEFEGLEVAKIYQAGSGLIAGDFYDLFRVSKDRVAAVIGDVAGKDIESSITAFQAKYLLRVFMRQFRDPAQALEELNRQMSVYANEDFISIVVLLFDSVAGTLRYASAGHPTVWLWHDREVHSIQATGSVVMLNSDETFYSREISVEAGDVALMYTDGISEVRKADGSFFSEERIGDMLRRDPNVSVDVMCKQILGTAVTYSDGPIIDDMAMMAIRLSPGWTSLEAGE